MENKKNLPEVRFKGFVGDWESRYLEDCTDLLTGNPFESKRFVKDGFFLVRGMNVKRGYLDITESTSKFWPSSKGLETFLLKDADILIQMDGALIGKSYARINQSNLPALLVQRVTRIRETKVDIDFVYQYIQRDFLRYIDSIKTETAVPHLSLNDIRNFEIAVPSNSLEQTQIGTYFQNIDQLISQQQQKQDKLIMLKKAMLAKMFPKEGANIPEIRFKGFSEAWEEKKLEDITSAIFDGTHQTPTYTDFGIPFFSVENLISSKSNKFISYADYLESTKINKPEKNDILITRIGNIGFSKVIDWDYPFSIYVTLAVIKQSSQFNSYFLNYNFQSPRYQNELLTNSLLTAVPCKINMNNLRETKITISTDLQEQKLIGSYFQNLDNLINQNKQQLAKLKQLKKACLTKMFVSTPA